MENNSLKIEEIAREIRKKVLRMLYESNSAHIGSNLSCIDILAVLYFRILHTKDRFILSKGHASAALYATLAQIGIMPTKLLDTFCTEGGLEGHPKRNITYGIEASTGSLGHGLSMGAGMALVRKNKVFVLMSDGECDEGSVWEAAKFASDNKLDNLVAIIDVNGWQAFKRADIQSLPGKWIAFGWEVRPTNGHNCQGLETQLKRPPSKKGQPICIMAHTIKGKGIPFLEDKMESHYHNLTKEEYEKSIR